jgi:hypothetical protein
MSQGVQITLIICGTIIIIQIFGFLIIKSLWNKSNKSKIERNTERLGYCKSPIYPRPLAPGSKIDHNPQPKGEKSGFHGSKV